MTMKPYIFLSGNYLQNTQDGNGNTVNAVVISNAETPYTHTVYFTDRYGNIVNRTFDTLTLKNTNISNMTVEAADGLGVFSTIFSIYGNTDSDVLVKNESATTTSCVRITVPQNAYNPQYITAQIGLYNFLCNLCALTDSSYKIDANEGSYRVVSGAYIHWADFKKWVCKIKMENLHQEQFNLLTAQADLGEMTVVPYQDLEADGIYECAAKREYSWELDRKTGLFKLDLELQEL